MDNIGVEWSLYGSRKRDSAMCAAAENKLTATAES